MNSDVSALIYYFKILNKLTPLHPNKFFLSFISLILHLVLIQPPSTDRLRRHAARDLSAFPYRRTDVWNRLPTSIKAADSLKSFKSLIKRFDLTYFLKAVLVEYAVLNN